MIIPFFLLNRGCPHRCIYCNTRQIAGKSEEPMTAEHIHQTVTRYIGQAKDRPEPVELAFYGGNFTGMDRNEQTRLLEITDNLIERGMIHQVRIATRPDDLDTETLDMLKKHRVETIEIGVQSMADDVLNLSRRGHTSEDVTRAIGQAKGCGFTVGVHLMAGLPGDNANKFRETIRKTIALRPDMVRLHPTLVFADTPLANMYQAGEYAPLDLAEAVRLCKYALVEFERAGICLIRLSLQETELMRAPGNILAGPSHPAFRSLVEASLFRDMAVKLLQQSKEKGSSVTFYVNPRDVSSFRGERNGNIQDLYNRFQLANIRVLSNPHLDRGTLVLSLDRNGATLQLKRTDPF
ncbi:MAG: radical SAM protein [Syntrophaceae bacterium]|nr:radical SAM protein [Syntrophaceae bacterium]